MKQTILLVMLVSICATLLWPCESSPLNPLLCGTASAPEPQTPRTGLAALVDKEWARQIESANALVEAGQLDRAEATYVSALTQAESAGDDLRIALALRNLGWLLDRRGELLQAEKLYLRAIQALARSQVREDKMEVRISLGLTTIYIQTGQHSKGEQLIRRLLTDYPGADDSDKVSLMGNLGVVLASKRHYEEAEQAFRETAEVCAGASSIELQEVGAIAKANMAGVQMRRGRKAEAVVSFREAIAVMEALPKPSPAPFAATLGDYAGLLRDNGDLNAAEAFYRKSIAVAETRLGPSHPVLGGLLEEYAGLLRGTGRRSEARKLAKTARRIQDESARENLTRHTIEFSDLGSVN